MKKRNRGQRVIVFLLMAVTLLMAALSCALAVQMYRRTDPSLTGTWRMRFDLTETARLRGNAWLRGAALGDRVDMLDALPPLWADLVLELREDGTWARSVDAGTLAYAEGEARRALTAALNELLRLRVDDAGRPAVTAGEAGERIEAALGMSGEAYLAAYGPALLPDEGELRERFDGSGRYSVEGPRIRFDDEAPARYLADDALLVIDKADGTEVYARA